MIHPPRQLAAPIKSSLFPIRVFCICWQSSWTKRARKKINAPTPLPHHIRYFAILPRKTTPGSQHAKNRLALGLSLILISIANKHFDYADIAYSRLNGDWHDFGLSATLRNDDDLDLTEYEIGLRWFFRN